MPNSAQQVVVTANAEVLIETKWGKKIDET